MTVAKTKDQRLVSEHLDFSEPIETTEFEAEDGIGSRYSFRTTEFFACTYKAEVEITRPATILKSAPRTAIANLPDQVIRYLLPSCYCNPDDFDSVVAERFPDLDGGDKILAMIDWIETHFQYTPGASNSSTTATDSFSIRKGVCRDYAHVLIAMVRAAGMPARMVSAYSPSVKPQDFHAMVEVYVSDRWHLVDPTKMTRAENAAIIGVGRDAADISFLTSFGTVEMKAQSVAVVISE